MPPTMASFFSTTAHNPKNYKPVGEWSGRLIFNREDRLENGNVLIEIHNAPFEYTAIIGKQIELSWALDNNKELQNYVDFLTTDVTFSDEAINSSKEGRIHPKRLNSLKDVGPLESLAGARPSNNVHVVLESDSVTLSTDRKFLQINKPPIQIRGRKRCLAKFVGRSRTQKDQLFEIVHFNPISNQFDGETETILVPTFPKNNRGLHVSTAHEIEKSPVNDHGWYLYGYFDEINGVFVVEAWEPRRVLIVGGLDHVVSSTDETIHIKALSDLIWTGARYKKGMAETFLLDPTKSSSVSDDWKEGDRFLVIHLFGGIGGQVVNEENIFGIIPGHFSFGDATIVRCDFTNEIQFRIIYRQVYAHNNGGIIAGPNMWSSYCGDLERGWLGTRPISDIIVKLDIISKTYKFGNDISICPLDEFIRELNEMGARYRTGDGRGCALVSPAHSCVQDSNQALYASLDETYRKFRDNPRVQEWKLANPTSKQTEDMAKLQTLYDDVGDYLTPFGIRKDWHDTAKGLRGTASQSNLVTLIETFRTCWTVVPRRAHDQLAEILLRHGAKLWFIRTNQIGGNDNQTIPLAPATIFDYRDNRKDPTKEGPSSTNAFCCGCCESLSKVADSIGDKESSHSHERRCSF